MSVTIDKSRPRSGDRLAGTVRSGSRLEQLRSALQSRHTIGVAQGMLMYRYGLSQGHSFRFLSRLSQESNTKLRDIAAKVVTEHQTAEG